MIILGLYAENLLKYRTLRLDELPEQGVIAVSGDNESGKSAIGEIICFALFGRTYALAREDLRKLVRWGASHGQVTLRLCAKDRELEIVRQLDRGGDQSAKLFDCERPEKPLARGLDPVNEQMEQMLGFDFEEYIETFYLAQREVTTPHPNSPAVKAMAGIAPLERCAGEFRQQIARKEETVRSLEREIAELSGELASLGPERLRVEELEGELARKSVLSQQLSDRVEKLGAAADAYCTACGGLRFQAVRRAVAGMLQTLLLLLALAVVALWALLRFDPQLWPLPMVRERLEGFLAAVGIPAAEATLAYGAIALLGMLLLAWFWSFALSLGMKRRRARGRNLGEELRLVDALEPAHGPIATGITTHEGALEPGDVSLELPPILDKPDSERRSRLAERARVLDASPGEVRAAARHEIAWMERQREALNTQRESLEKLLGSARLDRVRGQELEAKKEELAERRGAFHERIETRRLACELLDGAARRFADGFNEHLRGLISRILPRFTDGRYEYLQVGDDLQVRIYSNEKRSFLDLEEISAGTQRQIMLALRLALAQEQVARIAKDRQFAFLDEPFAFFDDTRMRGSLRLLPELSDVITQHWVVGQRFPRDEFVALEISCESHSDTLALGRSEAGLRGKRRTEGQ